MDLISDNDVKQAIAKNNIQSWILRRCSLCNTPLIYRFYKEFVTYDASCNCVTFKSSPQLWTYQDVADVLNEQKPAIRQEMWHDMLKTNKVK